MPQIKTRLVKGQAIRKFERGMVYVLEFWATWCGPCIKAMPHITEQAKRYAGKATFIGVDVWERDRHEQNIVRVDSFVRKMGDRMGYNVCMDSEDGFMVNNWLIAAGQSGIPTTIIVNQQGKIAWIGNPMEMDIPLAAIINGSFNLEAFALKLKPVQEKAFQQRREMEQMMAVIKIVQDAVENKEYKKAINEYDNITTKNPSYKELLVHNYYIAVLNLDPERLYDKALLLKDSTSQAADIAKAFSVVEGLGKKYYRYAIDFYEHQRENMFNWPILSAAYFNHGDVAKAVSIQQKWIKKMKTFTAPASAQYVEKETRRLKAYEAALKEN